MANTTLEIAQCPFASIQVDPQTESRMLVSIQSYMVLRSAKQPGGESLTGSLSVQEYFEDDRRSKEIVTHDRQSLLTSLFDTEATGMFELYKFHIKQEPPNLKAIIISETAFSVGDVQKAFRKPDVYAKSLDGTSNALAKRAVATMQMGGIYPRDWDFTYEEIESSHK